MKDKRKKGKKKVTSFQGKGTYRACRGCVKLKQRCWQRRHI